MDQSEPGTGMYDVQELLRRWEYGELTTEQMIGQLLLALERRVETLENQQKS